MVNFSAKAMGMWGGGEKGAVRETVPVKTALSDISGGKYTLVHLL